MSANTRGHRRLRASEPWSNSLRHDLDPDNRRRNCDGAVERSTLLETLDEIRGLRLGHASYIEAKRHFIEKGRVSTHRLTAIDGPLDAEVSRSHRHAGLASDHL